MARRLGIVEPLLDAGGCLQPLLITYMFGSPVEKRDFRKTTPEGDSALNIYHPAKKEALLDRARRMGGEVKRGSMVVRVDAADGTDPLVAYQYDGELLTESARVVIGADGRDLQIRSWLGFKLQRDAELLILAGTLMKGTEAPDDAVHLSFGRGCLALVVPLKNRPARTYFAYPGASQRRGLSGKDKFGAFVEACREAMVPDAWLAGVECIGPLAEFAGYDRWVESPARNGVVLIGDAAASTDPSWGCGLSLTLTDVEHLAAALRITVDRDEALARYAREHDEYYAALHRILAWMTELTWTPGPEADERRQRVFPPMMADPRGFPDAIGQGPFGPCDEQARRLVLGLDPVPHSSAASGTNTGLSV
jgi:2-polyprenyl-6-methoxyphenol hydroxylase-like FAD-dependent oxidoreductase